MLSHRDVCLIVNPNDLKAGDVIGFSGNSWISALINIGTYGIPFWGVSHVGIMAHAADGRLLLFESTTLENMPCELSGQCFNGTQAHDLTKILKAYAGKVWNYSFYRPLYEHEENRLTRYLMATVHTPYDEMGAFRAAGVGFSLFESLLHPEDMHHIFCSAWVAKALSEVGVWATDDADRFNPNHLCRLLRLKQLVCRPRRLA